MNNKEIELRVAVLLSTYSALIGRISPNMRSIHIDWGDDFYIIKAYFDRPTDKSDLELLSDVSTEVAADFPKFKSIDEYVEYSVEPAIDLKPLKEVVFMRLGELE